MRVCHMTSAHEKEDERIFHKECVSLAKAGYEVYLVQRGESYEKYGVRIVGVGEIPDSRFRRMTIGAKRVFEKAMELDCDIYHFHDPELLPYGLKLKKQGKKVVFDIHEYVGGSILEKQYIPMFLRDVISKLYTYYEKLICKDMSALVTVTPSQTAYYRSLNPNTVEVTNYPYLTHEKPTCLKKRMTVGFAGGLSAQWNHDVVIRVLAQVEGAEYVLCGKDNSYVEQLKSLREWKIVDFKGHLPHEQIDGILRECMVGVALLTPGYNTAWQMGTMGNTKIFEEMLAGLPVVCTDFTLWRDFVERYHCGICVDPKDETAVREAFRVLLENPELAKEMGQNGYRAVAEEFNWHVTEKELLNLYQSLS